MNNLSASNGMIGSKSLKLDIWFYFLILIGFYLLNRFSPFITDDYFYAFVIKSGANDGVYEPISGLSDVIRSQSCAYLHQNGRFVVHSIVQLFCGLWGMKAFVIFNSIMFLLLVMGISKCIRYYRKPYKYDAILIFLLLLLFIPIFGKTYLGNISFSVNYLWTSTAVIWWYYLLISQRNNTKVKSVFLFLFSVLVGSLQESFSIGIVGALVIYYILNYRAFKGAVVYLSLGFILGSCFVVFAPANFTRFVNEQGGTFNIQHIFLQILRVALSLRMFWAMIVCLAIFSINKTKRFLYHTFKRDGILIWASCINVAFAAIIAMNGKHQLVCVELFSTIVVINILTSMREILKLQSMIMFAALVASLMLSVPIYMCRSEFYNAHQLLLDNALDAQDGIVDGGKYESLCIKESSWFVDKYAMKDHYWSFNRNGLSLILSEGRDASKIKAVLPDAPNEIIAHCFVANKIQDCVYKLATEDYYILKIPEGQIQDAKAFLYHKPGLIGSAFYTLLGKDAKGANAKEISLEGCNRFYREGYWYVVVCDSSPINKVEVINL